jgi:hypothetical protein
LWLKILVVLLALFLLSTYLVQPIRNLLNKNRRKAAKRLRRKKAN